MSLVIPIVVFAVWVDMLEKTNKNIDKLPEYRERERERER